MVRILTSRVLERVLESKSDWVLDKVNEFFTVFCIHF